MKDPPQILDIYCGGNNILMQHAAKLIKWCISIIKTAKHFQTIANHHFNLVPEFVPGFMEDREESNRFKKFRKRTDRTVAFLQKRLDREYIYM